MSLVNLAHVCSHLQNASLARLGLTSIPYTKLHLSLALLLQKQGFLSQVRLGGPSPPASVFGHGPRDNHFVTNHPHGAAERNQFSPEAALAAVVRNGYTAEQLAEAGYGREAIEFAQEHGRRTTEDLEKAGWPQEIARFVSDIRAQTDALAEEREGQYLKRREQHASRVGSRPSPPPAQEFDASAGRTAAERREKVEEEILATLPAQRREIYRLYKDVPRESLLRTKFDPDTLRYIAGRHGFLTERELKLHGITIEAMGLRISNQTITLPVDDYQDPAHMETEGVVTQENRASRRLWLGLKYYESLPVLSKAKMVSKPSKRIWLNSRELGRIVRGSQAGEVKALTRVGEIMAVRTVRGILEARECVERQVGGMPLCRVW